LTKGLSFLNPAGPGDYELPSSFGSKSVVGKYRNMPHISMKERISIPKTREFADVKISFNQMYSFSWVKILLDMFTIQIMNSVSKNKHFQ
jgi:hypothetical protein